ncbi:MAG: YceI family protein [Chloroflexi bacterium]|nr:MAG: YceI family protein [Chloroflexota bacterium]
MSWKIDAIHSHVSFAVRHLMVSTVRGRFNRMRGQIHIDESQPANSWVEAEVDAATIDTQIKRRDAHLRTADFFEVDTYPAITFKSTKVEAVSGQEYRVTGDFTMHGVTKPVTFDVEYGGQSNMAGPRVGLTVTTKINRKDFGLSFGAIIEAGQVALGEIVTIEIDVEATTQSAAAQVVETAQ